jgi:hypothetical protein
MPCLAACRSPPASLPRSPTPIRCQAVPVPRPGFTRFIPSRPLPCPALCPAPCDPTIDPRHVRQLMRDGVQRNLVPRQVTFAPPGLPARAQMVLLSARTRMCPRRRRNEGRSVNVLGGAGRQATRLPRRGLGSPRRLVAAAPTICYGTREPVRSRRCLPSEDGGDLLRGHAMQVQVHLLRALDCGTRRRGRLSGPRHLRGAGTGLRERGPGASRVLCVRHRRHMGRPTKAMAPAPAVTATTIRSTSTIRST